MAADLSIMFTGVFVPCLGFESLILEKGKEVFGDLHSDIAKADLAFVNLEAPLTLKGTPITKAGPNLKGHPSCVKALADAGFNLVGLANNHIMDFGEEGLSQTLQTCQKAGLMTVGAGSNLSEARKIAFIEKKGLCLAVIALAEHEFGIAEKEKAGAAPLDLIDNLLQIEQAREKADLVFVTIHGGNEYFPYPRPGLRRLCRFYIERGADAVICHHPHVPGAYEWYQDKPIIYSLGNLIFDTKKPASGWHEGYAFSLSYDVETKSLKSSSMIAYTQSLAQGGIQKMTDQNHDVFMERLEGYEKVLADSGQYKKVWNAFCDKQKAAVLMRQYFPFQMRGLGLIAKILNPARLFLATASTRSAKLNMLKCESHRELLCDIVEREHHAKK